MKINKKDHNFYGFDTEYAEKFFAGDLTYLNTFCVMGNYKPVAVFRNSNPDRSKDYKDFMLLWVDHTLDKDGKIIKSNTIISGIDADEMEDHRYQTGMYCPDCKDVIYSVNRHDYRVCSCEKCMVDGGKDYFKTNMGGQVVKIDLLTDKIKIIPKEEFEINNTNKTFSIKDISKEEF